MKKRLMNLNLKTSLVKDKVLEELNKLVNVSGDKLTLTVDLTTLVPASAAEPKIYITSEAFIKMKVLVAKSMKEVAWHGLVEKQDNQYVIYDCLVFPQEVTSATAEGIDGEYEQWLFTLPDDQFKDLRCHMHSHVNMGVTPSATDETYYDGLMTQVKDYYITVIINKSGAMTVRLYDVESNILWTDLTIHPLIGDTPADDWYAEVLPMIKERKPVTYAYPRGDYRGYTPPVVPKKKDTPKKEESAFIYITVDGDIFDCIDYAEAGELLASYYPGVNANRLTSLLKEQSFCYITPSLSIEHNYYVTAMTMSSEAVKVEVMNQ